MLSREAPLPLYYQIELHLREAIEAGRYQPGDRLPTEGELQHTFGVSRVTVRTALRRLEEDGLISTQRGRGTFVTTQANPKRQIERHPARLLAFEQDLRRYGVEPHAEVLAVEWVPASSRVAGLLDVPPGQEVLRLRRLGYVDDAPLWVESRHFHPRVAAVLAEQDLRSASITTLLQQIAGKPVTSSRLRISAGAATPDQARLLALAPGEPVLINEFADYVDDQPIEAARAVFRGDRYAFIVEVFSSHGSVDEVLRSSRDISGTLSLIRQEVSP